MGVSRVSLFLSSLRDPQCEEEDSKLTRRNVLLEDSVDSTGAATAGHGDVVEVSRRLRGLFINYRSFLVSFDSY